MDGVRIRRLQPGDEGELLRFEEAFDHPIDVEMARRFLADPGHHLLVAYVEDRPAGFVSSTEILHPDKRPELFLNEIGVVESLRRRGAAAQLIEALKELARELGCASIWVLTDEGNPPAMGLYAKAGGRWDGEHQVMFEYDVSS